MSVSRNEAYDNLMIADDGMERVWTEAFVPRFKMAFGPLLGGRKEEAV
jgi:hypothetical protein